jgi:hypothetical protein
MQLGLELRELLGLLRELSLQPLHLRRTQHTSAYVSMRQRTSACASIRQDAPAYVSIRQHTPAYVCIRQHSLLSGSN